MASDRHQLESSAPSLMDILSRYSLHEGQLQKECPQDVLLHIATQLCEWSLIGRRLKVPRQALTAIDRDNNSEGEKKLAMLDTWHEREGSEATYLKLA